MNRYENRVNGSVWTLRSLLLAVIALLGFAGSSFAAAQNQNSEQGVSMSDPAIKQIMSVQDRHTTSLLAIPGINGVGTGLSDDGKTGIIVFTLDDRPLPELPDMLEGVAVFRKVIGDVRPIQDMDGDAAGRIPDVRDLLSPTLPTIESTARVRPVPIGASTGNYNDCSAGTIGVRVRRGSSYFALSNNHVFSRTSDVYSSAAVGEFIVQPGRGDISCSQRVADTVGRLVDFEPFRYGSGTPNTMDAAMISVDPYVVLASTPPAGYGTPSTTTVTPSNSMSVKKYGKGSGLTVGTICAVNVTISVSYANGIAYFAGQFVVQSGSTPFVEIGDSGSLVVTNTSSSNPVGLLFARSGTLYTFATPINTILTRFDVSIDDGAGSPTPVELSAFSGTMRGSDVHLKWRTETELNNFGFAVQRSLDKEQWDEIAFVAGAGESYSPKDYSYTDAAVTSRLGGRNLFYRLLQIDRDGTQEYSSILEISQRPSAVLMQVFPHPVQSDATLRLNLSEAAFGSIQVYDALGRRLDQYSQLLHLDAGTHLLPLPLSSAPAGNYFVEYSSEAVVLRKHILVRR